MNPNTNRRQVNLTLAAPRDAMWSTIEEYMDQNEMREITSDKTYIDKMNLTRTSIWLAMTEFISE